MTSPYITRVQLKAELGIVDSARDTVLDQKIAAATKAVDRYAGRTFGRDVGASARVYNPMRKVARRPDGEILLVEDIADTAGLIVETGAFGSWSALGAADFEMNPDNALATGWPIEGLFRPYGWVLGTSSRVRVTAVWGWPAVPDDVVQATLLQASRYFSRKDSPEGVRGDAEWGSMRVARVDPDVATILGTYIKA